MPSMLIDLGALQIAAQAGGAERIPPQAAPFLTNAYRLAGSPVALLHPFGETGFYRHGWHSWSRTAWLKMGQAYRQPQPPRRWPMIDHPALIADYPFSGSGVGAVEAPDGNILLLGALDLDGFVGGDTTRLRGAYSHPEASPRRDWFLAYGDEQQVFAAYTGLLAERFGRRGGSPPRVWCSWYSLYREIDEGQLAEIIAGLDGLPFDVFQVDDGWQQGLGDWQANERFGAGMPALAERIRRGGYTPGLWLAPLAVAPGSDLYRRHPDWVVRDLEGRPSAAGYNWGSEYFGLDVTHPGAREWLAGTIRQAVDWGYPYLKLDFLYAGGLPGERYKPLPGDAALRSAMELIREAAGEAYILACGAPVYTCLGLADGLRVGPDVTPFWHDALRSQELNDFSGPSTLNAIRTTLHRLWLRPLIDVDPDVVFFRTRYNLLGAQQKQILQDLAQIAGFAGCSDPPGWLDPQERQALAAYLAARPQAARLSRYHFQLDGRSVDFSFLGD